jgi:hypothetical protein
MDSILMNTFISDIYYKYNISLLLSMKKTKFLGLGLQVQVYYQCNIQIQVPGPVKNSLLFCWNTLLLFQQPSLPSMSLQENYDLLYN